MARRAHDPKQAGEFAGASNNSESAYNARRCGDGSTRAVGTADGGSSQTSKGDARPASACDATKDTTNVAAPAIRPTAASTWKAIGVEFVKNRAESKHKAFKQLQLSIMENCAILAPDYLSPKDIVGMAMDVEKFLKDNPEVVNDSEDVIDVVARFLNGGAVDSKAAIPDSPHEVI